MDFAKSQFEAAFASKRPLTKQGLSSLIDGVDSSQLSALYRWLFHRLNDQLLHLARHNQAGDLFLSARQVSFQLHEHFIGKFSSSSSSMIKQLGQTLKSLQQQPTLTQSELNQWKRSQQGLRRDDYILHCLFNNSAQLALTNDTSIFLGDLFRVALHTCVQNLADRDNKTSLKILLSLGLAPLDIIQRIMSTTVYHDLRTFCAQYLNDFGEEFYLTSQETNTLGFLSQLKLVYTSETVVDLMESKKQSLAYWSRIFNSTPSISTFHCQDIVPNSKQAAQLANAVKRIAYMQVNFDWIHTTLERDDGADKRWFLMTEGRHLIDEQPLFSAQGRCCSEDTLPDAMGKRSLFR